MQVTPGSVAGEVRSLAGRSAGAARELQLNGASSMASTGPRRFAPKVMREVTGAGLGRAVLARITANIDKTGRSKLVHQRAQLGDAVVNITQAKKGDKAVDSSLRLVLLGKG